MELSSDQILILEMELPDSARVPLSQAINFDEFGAAIVNWDRALSEFINLRKQHIPLEGTQQLVLAWHQHLARLMQWVRSGQTGIFFIGGPHSSGGHEWVENPFLPINKLKLRVSKGNRVRYVGPALPSNKAELREWQFSYYLELQNKQGIPLLVTDRVSKGAPQVVGAAFAEGEGWIVLLPHTFIPDSGKCVWLVQSIVAAVEGLTPKSEHPNLPAWVNEYTLPIEEDALNEISRIRNEIEVLNTKIIAEEAKLFHSYMLKALIGGTDDEAEIAVRYVLRKLGAKVSNEVPNRAEAVILWRDKVIALEVKGLTKSSAESWLRQTDSWRSEVMRSVDYIRNEESVLDQDHNLYKAAFEEIGLKITDSWPDECYGLLVSVTHRMKPFHERTPSDHDYPPQMKTKLAQSLVTAITGQQLLELYLECGDDREKSEATLDMLLSGKGEALSAKPKKPNLRRIAK